MKNRSFRLFITLFLCMSLVACNSSGDETTSEDGSPKKEVIPKAINDFKTIINQNPGKFSGDQYNEEAVKKELDQFPANLSDEEYFDRLVYLFAENYQPQYAIMQTIDPSIHVNQKTPDGKGMPKVDQVNVQILLDASGSMAGKVSGGQKMDLAKQAIKSFAAGLPEETSVSLRVYGHKGSNSSKDKSISCQSNEVVYPMSTYSETNFNQALNKFKPTGWTPLASAIQAAKQDVERIHGENVQNIVYVVSDGVETCGGNPVEAAKSLTQVGVKPVVNIIGFDVDDKGQEQLKKVAEAAEGEFKPVYSQSDLENYLKSERERLKLEWGFWSNAGQVEAVEIWAKKTSTLFTTVGNITSMQDNEEKRIKKALDYLEKSGKVKDGLKIFNMTTNRWSFIYSKVDDEKHRIMDELAKAEEMEKERIKKEAEEGKNGL